MRRIYRAVLPALVRRKISSEAPQFPFEVYSYSGEATLPEQVASIRSFLRHVGQPISWTVASDGSYHARSVGLLRSISARINVLQPNEWLPNSPMSYLREHPTGRQLALIMSLPRDKPALYLDSDVLFFGSLPLLSEAGYLADCQLSGDERLFHSETEKENPVNTGVLFLPGKIDWSLGIKRLEGLEGPPTFFTNQTITHLVMHANDARPFDPRRFILQLDDQFIFSDSYAGPRISLRHYVQPVRHKFWTAISRRCVF